MDGHRLETQILKPKSYQLTKRLIAPYSSKLLDYFGSLSEPTGRRGLLRQRESYDLRKLLNRKSGAVNRGNAERTGAIPSKLKGRTRVLLQVSLSENCRVDIINTVMRK